jgi:hypothetical protein
MNSSAGSADDYRAPVMHSGCESQVSSLPSRLWLLVACLVSQCFKEPDEKYIRFGLPGHVVPLPKKHVQLEPLLPRREAFVGTFDPPPIESRY